MRVVRGIKLSPATAIACIALLVSLTGTSVAAVSQLAKNSVGTPQLKKNAVTSPKVKNGSLLRADFKAGQIPRGPRGARGPAAPPARREPPEQWDRQVHRGRQEGEQRSAFKTLFTTTGSESSATTFEAVPEASTTLIVPDGSTATFHLTFSSESTCDGVPAGVDAGWCSVRILVDGAEAAPVLGDQYAFDSSDSGTETEFSWESHAMQRAAFNLGAGSHTVTVQRAVSHPEMTLWLFGWTLTVQAFKE